MGTYTRAAGIHTRKRKNPPSPRNQQTIALDQIMLQPQQDIKQETSRLSPVQPVIDQASATKLEDSILGLKQLNFKTSFPRMLRTPPPINNSQQSSLKQQSKQHKLRRKRQPPHLSKFRNCPLQLCGLPQRRFNDQNQKRNKKKS